MWLSRIVASDKKNRESEEVMTLVASTMRLVTTFLHYISRSPSCTSTNRHLSFNLEYMRFRYIHTCISYIDTVSIQKKLLCTFQSL